MKRALVTGGSGSIGRVICRSLARQGFHIIVQYAGHPDRAEEVVAEIVGEGLSAEPSCMDVTCAEGTCRAVKNLLQGGPIQVLVHSAGTHDDAPMVGMTHEQWARVVDVSLNGFFNVTQPLLLPMIGTRWGRIISISSIAGVTGNRGQTNYAAAKAGLHGASKSLAMELASRGITVNVVAPGLVQSPNTEGAFTQNQVEAIVPMKRMGTPQEVADLVVFLASEKAGYISGQVIGINGAMPC